MRSLRSLKGRARRRWQPPIARESTLVVRLWAKVDVRGADDCWPWTAAMSIGGQRCVPYGTIRQGGRGTPMWRVNRLVLVLEHGDADLPMGERETLDAWLARAFDHYRDVEASHTCDNSVCCNPGHLEWKTHTDNVVEQAERRQAQVA